MYAFIVRRNIVNDESDVKSPEDCSTVCGEQKQMIVHHRRI